MNRNILFRGKELNYPSHSWHKGYYVKNPAYGDSIYHYDASGDNGENTYSLVIPDTVGQYSYSDDCNDNYIFEGDIVRVTLKIAKHQIIGIVYFDLEDNSFRLRFDDGSTIFLDSGKHDNLEVIGNIFDNEDLIKDFLPIDKELT